jgi:hypothetical protein
MPRPSKLASLSVDALFKLRNEVTATLNERAKVIEQQLAALGLGLCGGGPWPKKRRTQRGEGRTQVSRSTERRDLGRPRGSAALAGGTPQSRQEARALCHRKIRKRVHKKVRAQK